MRNQHTPTALAIGCAGDALFWSALDAADIDGLRRAAVETGADWRDAEALLSDGESLRVVLLCTSLGSNLPEAIAHFRRRTGASSIVAGPACDGDVEDAVRRSGILCLLLLPDEALFIGTAVRSAFAMTHFDT